MAIYGALDIDRVLDQLLPNTRPSSLHNMYIPSITEPGNPTLPLRNRYQSLEWNDPPVEKSSPDDYRKLTPENFARLLVPHKSVVVIPVSLGGIHWSIIKEHGHDRLVTLQYVSRVPMGKTGYQLNFRLIGNSGSHIDNRHYYACLACRSSELGSYTHPMYYVRTPEESYRHRSRTRLLLWRTAVDHDDWRVPREECASFEAFAEFDTSE